MFTSIAFNTDPVFECFGLNYEHEGLHCEFTKTSV